MRRIVVCCHLALGLAAAAAFAEDPPPTASATSGQLPEVVVTANKRAENSKDVPISIGVVSGSDMSALHIQGYEDLARLVPGVSFTAHNGPGQDNISIRGVSSQVGNPTVGFYIDEVPIITNNGYEGAAEPRMLDIDRVEILRGPQGTLYGASSEGGTIRFLSNQPKFDAFTATGRTELSQTRRGGLNYDQQVVLNAPVSESFALRLAADFGKQSGYIDHYRLDGTLDRRGTNSEIQAVLQLTGKWLVSEDLSITPSLFYQRVNAADSPTFIPALGMFNQNKQVVEFNHDELIIPSLTIKKSFDVADLTSVTSFVDRRIDRQADGTIFNSGAIAQFFLDPSGPPYSTNQVQNDTILANIASPVLFTDRFQTFTQELRLSSPAAQKSFKWVVGAFFADQKWSHLDYEVAPGFGAAFQGIYGYPITADPILDPTGDPALWANDLVWTVNDHNEVKQQSVFGQVDFDLTPRLHAGVGERFVYAKETFSETGGGFFDLGGAGVPPSPPYTQAASFKSWTPKFSLTYDATPDVTVYGSAAKGFRLGGATTPNTNAACVTGLQQLGFNNAPSTYDSDELWNYELGTKALLDDKTLSVNADVYLIDWSRIQQTIIIPVCGGQFNANVGDARAYGSEIEIRYRPRAVPGLTLGLAIGAEHATITRTIDPATADIGQWILFTPDFTGTLTADYGWNVADTGNAFVRGTVGYIGSSYGSYQTTSSQYNNPAYTTVNLAAGIELKAVEIALFAKNLFDNKTILQQPQINTVIEGYSQRPRTVGVTLSYKL